MRPEVAHTFLRTTKKSVVKDVFMQENILRLRTVYYFIGSTEVVKEITFNLQ